MALVLNPRTGHVSPQFHVKFDDFFETIQAKSTDLETPDPAWKYLSGFATRKGATKTDAKGGLDGLLAPRRGASAAMNQPQAANQHDHPAGPIQDLPMPLDNGDEVNEHPAIAEPAAPAATPLPQQDPPPTSARQTQSGRVIKNTPRYDQSMALRNQGIVAWELLIDQDEQEDRPTAEAQFAMQKALEDPIPFAATTNPDILYWDQAMKAHNRDKLLEAVSVELDRHERTGNYEPIPIEKVPQGTKLIDMVWSMRHK